MIARRRLLHLRILAVKLFVVFVLSVLLVDVALSNSIIEFLVRSSIFIIVLTFSVLLARIALREIKESERLSRTKSDFVYIVSHQLRTSLATIKGFISLIKEGSGSKEDRRGWLDKTYEINERMILFVSDILNISRIERGKLQYSFRDTNIISLIEDVVTETRMQAEEKGIALNWEKPAAKAADVPPIRVDGEKFRQVILNLVDNAIHYTDKGHINVRLLYLPELSCVKITVRDTGIGISKEDLENLFEQFSRGEEGQKSNSQGLGLGLYVAQSIIKAHNGKIWAESEGINKGSRFYIELPVQ